MVMPQMVLYEREFYEQHKKEIETAAEAWGYALTGGISVISPQTLSPVDMAVFRRVA